MTVHKSLSYKWQNILLDANPVNRGVVNEAYFKWLYSGLSRSSNKVTLINFPAITPFCKSDIVDRSSDRTLPYLIIDNSIEVIDDSETYLDESEFKSIIVQLNKFFRRLVRSKNLEIITVTHNNYQEIYQITDGTNSSKVNVYYDKKGEVKYLNPTGKSADLNKMISDLLLTEVTQSNKKLVKIT